MVKESNSLLDNQEIFDLDIHYHDPILWLRYLCHLISILLLNSLYFSKVLGGRVVVDTLEAVNN